MEACGLAVLGWKNRATKRPIHAGGPAKRATKNLLDCEEKGAIRLCGVREVGEGTGRRPSVRRFGVLRNLAKALDRFRGDLRLCRIRETGGRGARAGGQPVPRLVWNRHHHVGVGRGGEWSM